MHHPYRADNLSCLIPEVFALFVNDAYLAARAPDHPMLDLVAILAFTNGRGIRIVRHYTVIRMNSFQESLVGPTKFLRLQAKDTIDLIRPGQFILYQIKLPTTQMSDFLGSIQPLLTFSESLLHPSALGDIVEDSYTNDNLPLVVTDRHRTPH